MTTRYAYRLVPMIFEQEQWSAEHYQYYSTETEFHLRPHRLRSCVGVVLPAPQLCPGEGRDNTRSRLQHLLLVVVLLVVDQRCQHKRLIKIERF